MKNKSKREFLKSIGSAGVFLAGANLPVWAINTSAIAATSGSSYKLLKPDHNGLKLMKGFTSRVIATSMKKTLSYRSFWHINIKVNEKNNILTNSFFVTISFGNYFY